MTFPTLFGDVPPIYFDPLNGIVGGFKDLRSGLGNGNGVPLSGASRSFVIYLDKVSNEEKKGKIQSDDFADYMSGNETSVLTYRYIVKSGDGVQALDVVGMDFSKGMIFNPLTMASISTSLPKPGANGRSTNLHILHTL